MENSVLSVLKARSRAPLSPGGAALWTSVLGDQATPWTKTSAGVEGDHDQATPRSGNGQAARDPRRYGATDSVFLSQQGPISNGKVTGDYGGSSLNNNIIMPVVSSYLYYNY